MATFEQQIAETTFNVFKGLSLRSSRSHPDSDKDYVLEEYEPTPAEILQFVGVEAI